MCLSSAEIREIILKSLGDLLGRVRGISSEEIDEIILKIFRDFF